MPPHTAARCVGIALLAAAIAALAPSRDARAGSPEGGCTPSTGPDVIVASLTGVMKWGSVGGISAYSFGTTSCNIGDEPLPWTATTNEHPVIAQNLYRLKDGRFEQLGMSWLKHGWGALTGNLCCTCIDPNEFEVLGVGCSDPYDAGLNGDQNGLFNGVAMVAGLGPRSEVNASTGAFLYPYGSQGMTGDAIYKRLQVAIDDLDPELNPGARYFAEGHYITPHDAQFANPNNNLAHREMLVGSFTNGAYTLSFTGGTSAETPAVQAWQDADPDVSLAVIDIPDDGRMILGYTCSDNGDGTWHYEYALYNMNSHRGAGGFSVPIPAGVTVMNISFHDVDYHSGEPYDGTDWASALGDGSIAWATEAFVENENANALRWGTLYNFRFDADASPGPGVASATIGLFRPGPNGAILVETCAPAGTSADLNDDDLVNAADLALLLGAWGKCGACPAADLNNDNAVNAADLAMLLGAWTV